MQTRVVFVVTFLLFSNAAALAQSGVACQAKPQPHASSFEAAVLPVTLRGEGAFAQALPRSLCRPKAPLCTRAINYSVRQQWASSQ